MTGVHEIKALLIEVFIAKMPKLFRYSLELFNIGSWVIVPTVGLFTLPLSFVYHFLFLKISVNFAKLL